MLIDVLGDEHPALLHRMRAIVGDRGARITLDDESVKVRFGPSGLEVEPIGLSPARGSDTGPVDGWGETDSATVLALLEGVLEVSDAILDGALHVTGPNDAITSMFLAIEVLLDASPRTPRLQALAESFQNERKALRSLAPPGLRRPDWYPFPTSRFEAQLLEQLDLLPADSGR